MRVRPGDRFDRYSEDELSEIAEGLEEALDALRRSHEAGLVHMAYTLKGKGYVSPICSCCPCCCHTLGGLVRHGVHAKVLASRYVAEDDASLCTGCGVCADNCSFQTRELTEEGQQYDASRCFGCGLCVSTCPTGAIRLAERRGVG